jgi:hypothetical protein
MNLIVDGFVPCILQCWSKSTIIKNIFNNIKYVTLQKYFLHTSLIIKIFPTPPIIETTNKWKIITRKIDVEIFKNDYNNNIGGRDLKSLYIATTIAGQGP